MSVHLSGLFKNGEIFTTARCLGEYILKFFWNKADMWFCRIAYVRQEDLFFSQLTVWETLSLAAELQLPRSLSAEKKDKYVSQLLFRLGLVSLVSLLK